MKMPRILATASSVLMVSVMLAGCGGTTTPTTAPAAGGKTVGPDTYIPIISKGFQHQFWQAVKLGSENAAKDFNVKTTFEGPETEAMVDKQIEMLQAALDKKPAAICFAALDSKAAQRALDLREARFLLRAKPYENRDEEQDRITKHPQQAEPAG